jgi:asparagine synthase (glutamine-hydrolysing)
MCGIAGLMLAGPHDGKRLIDRAAAMSRGVAHRGPDGEGVWVDPDAGVALAHRRLAIIDLTDAGAQPMISGSGRHAIVYNGELYNFRELRSELAAQGVGFKGASDTEVLLEAWERWGAERTLGKLNGMFAFAVFDRKERRLTLARDPFGIKPLLWFRTGEGLFFASELKGLEREPTCPRDIDLDAVAALLGNGCIPAPATIYRNVGKLEPGSLLTFDATGDLSITRYWSPLDAAQDGGAVPPGASFADLVDETERVASDAVTRQMIADVPFGAFLSGGVDSSLVLALMQRNSSRPVDAFTIGFEEIRWDESAAAAKIADRLGARHHILRASGADALALATETAAAYDEPFADSSQIPTLMLCRMTRRHVTMALSGDGGDEVFAGYQRYGWGLTLTRLRKVLPQGLREAAFAAAGFAAPLGGRRGHKLARAAEITAAQDLLAGYQGFLAGNLSPGAFLLSPDAQPARAMQDARLRGLDPLTMFQCADASSYLPDDILVKVDRASMSVGLEVRVPLLDVRLWRLGMSTPPHWRRRKDKGKLLLRAVLERYVPAELFDRPKQGFALPLADWLRGPLRGFAADLLSSRGFRESGVFSLTAVDRVWKRHLSGREDHSALIWSILMYAAWSDRTLHA